MGVQDGSALLGYVHAGTVRAEFMRSVLDVLTDRRVVKVIDATAGSLIPKARNMLVAQFVASQPYEWLWMLDTDVKFDADTLTRLAEHADPEAHPVVSGVVNIGRPDGTRVASIFTAHDDGKAIRFEPVPLAEWVRRPLYEADAVGAACLLVHRSVLEKIRATDGPAWFTPIVAPNGLVGEDLSFCLRLRSAGIRPAVATTVRVGHVKTFII